MMTRAKIESKNQFQPTKQVIFQLKKKQKKRQKISEM